MAESMPRHGSRCAVPSVIVVAALLLLAAQWILRPAPLPALTAVVGGLVGLGLAGSGSFRLLVGALAGLLAGVLSHFYSHYSEGRLQEPIEGLGPHLVYDALEAAIVAAVVLFICSWLVRWLS